MLAVSGGLDSVVMMNLFKSAGFPFAVAHANFQLRGEDSNADEEFVKSLANQFGAAFFSVKFNTDKYKNENSVSLQVAARKLRYEWFEQILNTARSSEMPLINIATAHHLNDSIETVLLNLTRGTGVRGLRGIPERNGHVIRPLLFASRSELEDYAQQNGIVHREDSSNATDKYARNKIRHHVIPVLKEINPSLENTLSSSIQIFSELADLYVRKQQIIQRNLFIEKQGELFIPIRKLKSINHVASILYERLNEFGFNASQVDDLLSVIDSQPGIQFCSATHRIIRDRKFFILTPVSGVQPSLTVVEKGVELIQVGNYSFSFTLSSAQDVKVKSAKQFAFVDAALVNFPVVIRPWRAGDYFYPFGMKLKKKKLKKFFTDEKIPLHEKENALVMEFDGKIIWVCGHRLDERFRVTDKTKTVLKIELS
ncbi:MAG: tRNA lysidine(34) synthetase TilS [Bacteroidetes bacterium]|nr:tRNA lysidine(34) synthetase TilS [Bacteroidota bacterium]